MVVMERGPYAGGVRGGSDEPPFLARYTYYAWDRLTLDDGLSSKDDGQRSTTARVLLYAHRKASGFGCFTLRVNEGGSGTGDSGILTHSTPRTTRSITYKSTTCVLTALVALVA